MGLGHGMVLVLVNQDVISLVVEVTIVVCFDLDEMKILDDNLASKSELMTLEKSLNFHS